MFAYVQSLLRHPALAEDVTAQAFERALRKRRSFDPERGSARGWLFSIARNAALDELRRQRRRGLAPLDERLADDGPSVEERADTALRRVALRRALATLAPRERELIALKFFAGLDNGEIAGVLGVTDSNAGTLLHRAVRKLREACDDHA